MQYKFVASFPGNFLYSINSSEIIKKWMEKYCDNYIIYPWKDNPEIQKFNFTFTEHFFRMAYEGYKRKGETEFNRANRIKFLFKNLYKAELFSIGLLIIDVVIPEELDENTEKLAKNECEFQLFHVSKTIYDVIVEHENLARVEYKKFYVHLGKDINELSKKFALELKEHFKEEFNEDLLHLNSFREQLGDINWFPIKIFFYKKSEAFNLLMLHRSRYSKYSQDGFERDYLDVFRRIYTIEKSMFLPLNTANEGLHLYERLIYGLDTIKELYSVQLGISSTFLELTGFILVLLTALYSNLSQILFIVVLPFLLILFIFEFATLYLYSTGPFIEKEVDSLIEVIGKI